MRGGLCGGGIKAHTKTSPHPRCFRVDEVGRGCAKNHQDYNREPGFFVLAVEKFFEFRPDWRQDERARPVVQHYQTALDAVLQGHPDLERCVAHCVHCGIRFLTHSRCAGRIDLRCPFGCRQHHRRQRSSQRSAAYYRTAGGRRKKKRLNTQRRQQQQHSDYCSPPPQPEQQTATSPPERKRSCGELELQLEGVILREASLRTSPMLPYVRMVVSLIEGVRFEVHQMVEFLQEALRQHSMASTRRVDYVLRFLHQHPP